MPQRCASFRPPQIQLCKKSVERLPDALPSVLSALPIEHSPVVKTVSIVVKDASAAG
jgi:hypothetical protein